MNAILVKTDKSATVFGMSNSSELFDYYDGLFEMVVPRQLPAPYCMVVDESGIDKKLHQNEFGSMLYETDKHGAPIVGDVFIMKRTLVEGSYDLEGLSNEDIAVLCKKYELIVEKS